MDFPLTTFAAFSDALMAFYAAPTREVGLDVLKAALRRLFTDAEVEVVPRALRAGPPADERRIAEGDVLLVPVESTRWQLTLRRAEKFSRRERFLARLFSAHLAGALRDNPSSSRKPRGVAGLPVPELGALTPRETEVLRWIVMGKRDAQIATLIGAASRTVNKHVENILRKLGTETRSGAACCAAERPIEPRR
jgi:DNA-binding CsgD family transcriptional regulator